MGAEATQADIWLLGAPVDKGQRESLSRLVARLREQAGCRPTIVFIADKAPSPDDWSPWQSDHQGDVLWLVVSGDSASGTIGDLVGTVTQAESTSMASLGKNSPWALLNSVAQQENCSVAVWGTTGTPLLRTVLIQAAGYAGIPTYIEDESCVWHELPPIQTTPWLLAEAAARAAGSLDDVFGASDGVTDMSFSPLLRADKFGGQKPTVLLYRLWQDKDLALRQNSASACAHLLKSKGYDDEAQQLRALVDYWIRTDPWGQNYVPEMVGHGQAHAAAVDRNVAQLCRPFLVPNGSEAGDKQLSGTDVLDLAAAAWLHDWGHGSALDHWGLPITVSPVEARDWHGVLTAERLASREQMSASFPQEGFPFDGNKSIIAILAAHHQGWTCFGDTPKELAKMKKPPRAKPHLSSHTLVCDIVAWQGDDGDRAADRHGLADCDAELAKWLKENPRDKIDDATITRLRQKLAILRLADAVDVGIHRAPGTETQGERAVWIAVEYARRLSTSGRLTVVENAVRQDVKDAQSADSRKAISIIFRQGRRRLLEEQEAQQNKDVVAQMYGSDDCAGYAEHVATQYFYFAEQASIRVAIPFPTDREGLHIATVPLISSSRAANNALEKDLDPETLIRGFVVRELGETVHRLSDSAEPTDDDMNAAWGPKESVRETVKDMFGIQPPDEKTHELNGVVVDVLTWECCLAGIDDDVWIDLTKIQNAPSPTSIGPLAKIPVLINERLAWAAVRASQLSIGDAPEISSVPLGVSCDGMHIAAFTQPGEISVLDLAATTATIITGRIRIEDLQSKPESQCLAIGRRSAMLIKCGDGLLTVNHARGTSSVSRPTRSSLLHWDGDAKEVVRAFSLSNGSIKSSWALVAEDGRVFGIDMVPDGVCLDMTALMGSLWMVSLANQWQPVVTRSPEAGGTGLTNSLPKADGVLWVRGTATPTLAILASESQTWRLFVFAGADKPWAERSGNEA